MTSHARLAAAVLLALAASADAGRGHDAHDGADDGVVQRIKEAGEIVIGHRLDAAPHSYVGADNRPAGYSIDVCMDVVERLRAQFDLAQLRVRFQPVDATDRFRLVARGDVDLLCGAATITQKRRETVDFSIPTFVDGASVLTARGASESFADLAGKRIGVRDGTTTADALRASLRGFGMTAEVAPVADHADGLRALEKGAIDAYFGDQSILYALLDQSEAKDRLTVAANTLTLELHALALPLGDSRFRLAVDRALSEMYESGRMAAHFEKAFPGVEPSDAIRYLHTFAPVPP